MPGHRRHSPGGRDKYKQLVTGLWLMVCKCFIKRLMSHAVAHNGLCFPIAANSAAYVPFSMSVMYHTCSRTMGKRR